MKATSQKLKKLKVKQVYGFKKENFDNAGLLIDPTITTTIGIIGNR